VEGLDVTVIKLSEVTRDNRVFRVDAQYFSKAAITTELILKHGKWESLGHASTRIDSFGAYALTNEFSYVDEGVPFLRCLNIKDGFTDLANCLFITPKANNLLSKSAIEPGMVLLTMSGSVGEAAVSLRSWTYPVNSNQDIANITPAAGVSSYFLVALLNSRYGKTQTERLPVGSVQQHIMLWMLDELVVVRRFSDELEKAISRAVQQAYVHRESAHRFLDEAETFLTSALGLSQWHPPEPLTYTRPASEAFSAQRLDSRYFAPRVAELLTHLGSGRRSVCDVAPPRHEKFTPSGDRTFRYIEISDIRSDGTATAEPMPMREAPSRATWYVRKGDVITSAVRPIRCLSALITPEQDGCVASSGFVVLQPQTVPAEVLFTYLRLPVVCELMDLHTSASLYPAISDRDLLALPFPKIAQGTRNAVVSAVRSAHAARERAHELLAQAKRVVEVAIEDSEAAALKVLRKVDHA